MSVINDMLRDLEKRRGSLREPGVVPRHVRVLPAERKGSSTIAWRALNGAVAFACIGMLGAYVYDKGFSPVQPLADALKPSPGPLAVGPATMQSAQGGTGAVAPDAPLATASVVAAEPRPAAATRSEEASGVERQSVEHNALPPSPPTKTASAGSQDRAGSLIGFSLRMDSLPAKWEPTNTAARNSSTARAVAAVPPPSAPRAAAGATSSTTGAVAVAESSTSPSPAPADSSATQSAAASDSSASRSARVGNSSTSRFAALENSTGGRSAPPVSSARPQIDRKVRELTALQLAENEYRVGANLLNQGRHAEAQAQFAAALRRAPEHVGARQALFGLLLQANKTDEAEQVLQVGLKIDPTQSGFAMALARIQVERGDTAAAVQTLQKALPHAQGNPDYVAFLAALLQRQGRHAQAVELYEEALALAPRSGLWLMGLGISLQALNRNSEANDAFRRARAAEGLSGELQAFVDQRLKQVQ